MSNRNKFKLFLPAFSSEKNNDITLIAVDLRKEKTFVGLYKTEKQRVILQTENDYPTLDYDSVSDIIKQFIHENGLENVSRIAVAVPGPVIGGKSEPQRLLWKLDAEEIKKDLKVDKVFLINDLEASAYGLENVREEDIIPVYESEHFTPGNIAILAPNTGLGEAGLFWDGEYFRPFATEGGHCEFSPRTTDEVEFYQFLNKIYGIVSWESVLSISGLFNVYRFIRDIKQHQQPEFLTKAIEEDNFTETIIKGAFENKDRICTMTINTFLTFMAREANSLVLKLKATGGLILSGEIPLLLEEFLKNKKFYKHFIISDKMEAVLKDIPIYLVKDSKTIIRGAAMYAAFFEE
jgi:glucokinase